MASRTITVAAIQSSFGQDMAANIAKIDGFVREAAKRGAQVVLPPELFQSPYFPTRQDQKWFATGEPWREHPSVRALQKLAKELKVVIPISFFEKDGPRYYNSVAMADADGELLGTLPQEPHPRRAGLSGEILLPPRRHRLPGVEDQSSARSASASAGTNGTRRPRAPWC